jgi:hypothetical protein
VETRYHFVREFIEDDFFIKIEFVRSVENDSDLLTKKVNQLYAKRTKKLLEDSEVHSTG